MDKTARLKELKDFLRIDGNEEDELGIKEDDENSLYKLAVNMLVCGWYENRNPTDPGANNTQVFALKSIITQLKCSQSRG